MSDKDEEKEIEQSAIRREIVVFVKDCLEIPNGRPKGTAKEQSNE